MTRIITWLFIKNKFVNLQHEVMSAEKDGKRLFVCVIFNCCNVNTSFTYGDFIFIRNKIKEINYVQFIILLE